MSGIPDHWPAFAVGLLLIGIFLLGTLYYRQRYKTGVETQAELETRVARAEAMLATAPAHETVAEDGDPRIRLEVPDHADLFGRGA